MPIIAQKYTFHCIWKTDARLPEYLGSTLRGSLGWALKKCCCVLRRQECTACILRGRCAYAWIFETERYTSTEGLTVNARPHPFVIEPDGGQPEKTNAGSDFSFSINLFGVGNEHLPIIAHSVKLIGDSGIGSGRHNGLGRFELERIMQGDVEIYSSEEGILRPILLTPLDFGSEEEEVARCTVNCLTPLRVKLDNRLYRDLPFHVLIRTALRRIAALEYAYNGEEPDWDYAGLVERAKAVRVLHSQLRWRELFRYSNRQKAKVSLGGIVGEIDYAGDLREFMPILRYCEKVNIGKQTVFGLGKIKVSCNMPD